MPSPPLACLWLALFVVGLGGCGTNLQDILRQSGAAAGRSFLDVFLTDLVNTAASAEAAGSLPSAGTEQGGGEEPGAGTQEGGGLEGLVGDEAAGRALFTDNGCVGCHCDDASGGCALSAPALPGVGADEIDRRLRGDVFHPIKVDLSNQDVVDVQAFLASLASGGG